MFINLSRREERRKGDCMAKAALIMDMPDWCPLRELPVEKELYLSINSEKGYCVGWNACLGEILKTDGLRKEQ